MANKTPEAHHLPALSVPSSSVSPSQSQSTARTSGGVARRAIRVAQAAEDARLASQFDEAAAGAAGGDAFDYSASVGASRAIIQNKDGAGSGSSTPLSASATPGAPGVSVTAYLQRMQRGGLIQSFGCLLVLDPASFKVLGFSENAKELLGLILEQAKREEEARALAQRKLREEEQAKEAERKAQLSREASIGSAFRSLSIKIQKAINSNAAKQRKSAAQAKGGRAHTEAEGEGEGEGSPLGSPKSDPGLSRSSSKSSWNPFRRHKRAGSKGTVSSMPTSPSNSSTSSRQVFPEPLPKPPVPVLEFGASGLALFTAESAGNLKRAARAADVAMMNPVLVQCAVGERSFYAILHRVDVGLIVDLEPIRAEDPVFTGEGALQAHRLASKAMAKLEKLPTGNMTLLCDTLAKEVRELTGYDRVMTYKFHEDEHGEVLAEARKESMEPYLGLHYPATDIPQAARFLFMKNRVRIIVDATSDNVKVLQDETCLPQPVILSNSTLRAVHGCHTKYMQNMGTLASIGMAIVVNDPDALQKDGKKLWGLVVCHHETARYIPYPLRLACEFLMQVFSLKVNREMEMAAQSKERDMLRTQTLLCDMLLRDAPVGIVTQYPNIMDLVKSEGAALLYGGKFWLLGACPAETQLVDLVEWLQREHAQASGFSTDSLQDAGYPGADELGELVCGCIAVRLLGGDYLFWFRSPVEKQVMWSGAKHGDKEAGDKDDGRRMNPRSSFAAFLDVVKHRSQPWDDLDIDAVNSLAIMLRGHLTAFSSSDMQAMAHTRLADQDEEKMSVAESEISRILETATAPVFSLDLDGCISGWNNKLVQITGLSSGDALGRPFVRDLVHDSCRPEVQAALDRALRGQETKVVDIRVRKFAASASGECRPASGLAGDGVLRMNAFVMRESGGGVSGVCFVGQDVTQQKLVEGSFTKLQGDYAAIVHSGNSLIPPIFAIDESGQCAEWNPAMEKLTGLGRKEAVGQVVLGGLFGNALRMKADTKTKLMIVLNKAITGHNTERYPIAFLDRQGHLVEALLTVNARRDGSEEVTGAFCFLHCASAELTAALTLQRAAEEFAEAKSKAVAYVRQEIKPPLDGLKYVRQQMGAWPRLEQEEKRVLQMSVRCEQQLTRVLGDDNIENLEEGYLGLENDEYRLEDVVDAVASIGQQAGASKGLKLELECTEDLSTKRSLGGDALRLQQALSEFLATAIQFTPKGGWVRLKVITGTRALFADNSHLRCEFRLHHSGSAGVPPVMIKQMYDSVEDKQQMTQEGLGLSVARKIIQAMGGDVQYDRVFDHCGFVVRMALQYPLELTSSACMTPKSQGGSLKGSSSAQDLVEIIS